MPELPSVSPPAMGQQEGKNNPRFGQNIRLIPALNG